MPPRAQVANLSSAPARTNIERAFQACIAISFERIVARVLVPASVAVIVETVAALVFREGRLSAKKLALNASTDARRADALNPG